MAKKKKSKLIEVSGEFGFTLPPQDWCESNCAAGRFIPEGRRCSALYEQPQGQCKNPARDESR